MTPADLSRPAGRPARVARRSVDGPRDRAAARRLAAGRRALVSGERARIDAIPRAARSPTRCCAIVLTGAGTSAFIGDCLAPALSARLHRRVEAIATTDLVSGPHLRLPGGSPTLLVSFARSGNSPESVAALDLAEQMLAGRVHHLVITCNREGALALRAPGDANACVVLLPDATQRSRLRDDFELQRDAARAAALAFGATTAAAVARLSQSAATLAARGDGTRQNGWSRARYERVVYLGSNELRGLAAEAALKLLELTDGRIVARRRVDARLPPRTQDHHQRPHARRRHAVERRLHARLRSRSARGAAPRRARRRNPRARRTARRHRRRRPDHLFRNGRRPAISRSRCSTRWSRRASRSCSRSRSA